VGGEARWSLAAWRRVARQGNSAPSPTRAVGDGIELLHAQRRPGLVGHMGELQSVSSVVGYLMHNDQMMVCLDGNLNVVADDAGTAALAHPSGDFGSLDEARKIALADADRPTIMAYSILIESTLARARCALSAEWIVILPGIHQNNWCPACDAVRRKLHPPKPSIPRSIVEARVLERKFRDDTCGSVLILFSDR
jgi:hypothetical protein